MADDVKILTVVLDDDELVVDYSGLSLYEAYGMVCGVRAILESLVEGCDDETDET